MSQHVLVIVKAKNCGACTFLEKNLERLKQEIVAAKISLRLKEINLASTAERVDVNVYPAGLAKMIGYFPLLALIPGPEWDAAFAKGLGPNNNHDFSKTVSIFNGVVGADGRAVNIGGRDLYAGGLVEWLRSAMESPNFAAAVAPVPNFPPLISTSPAEKKDSAQVCTWRFISRRR